MPDTISIDALVQPALIIDLNGPAIRAANALARQLWGLDSAAEIPIQLDPQMPALARLRQDHRLATAATGRQIATEEPAPATSLVFWTAAGAQSLPCLTRPLGDPGAVLVIFEMTDEKAQPPAASSDGGQIIDTAAQPGAASVDMAAMAHELRTPIGAIIALAEMIETEQFGAIGDPRYRDYARDIGDSARLSLSIVAAALEHDTSDTVNLLSGFAELNVAELIDKSVRTVAQSASAAGIHLQKDVADDLPHLIANATGLTQILLNLLTNAIKFTPKGGTVTVWARPSETGLAISVSDTGVGMSGLDASVLIDASSEDGPAPDPATGTRRRRGIGFSLVRRLADAMSAHFDVTSTRGVGTRVTLTFPPAKVIPVAGTPDPA